MHTAIFHQPVYKQGQLHTSVEGQKCSITAEFPTILNIPYDILFEIELRFVTLGYVRNLQVHVSPDLPLFKEMSVFWERRVFYHITISITAKVYDFALI